MEPSEHRREPQPGDPRDSDGREQGSRYDRGLDDYHDPTAGIGGAPPARSALTLRLWLSAIGFALFVLATVLALGRDETWLAALAGLLAVVAAIDFGWVLTRKRRGEPG